MKEVELSLQMLQRRHETELKEFNDYAAGAEAVSKALASLPEHLRAMIQKPRQWEEEWKDAQFEISVTSGYMKGILLRMSGVTSFSEQVLPVLEEFEAHGLACTGSEDYPEMSRRTFILKNVVSLMVFIDSEAELGTCRVVETGEMQPFKKIVCS